MVCIASDHRFSYCGSLNYSQCMNMGCLSFPLCPFSSRNVVSFHVNSFSHSWFSLVLSDLLTVCILLEMELSYLPFWTSDILCMDVSSISFAICV